MPKKFDRCVAKVRGKGVKNPYAVCTAANAGNIKQYRRKHAKKGKRTR